MTAPQVYRVDALGVGGDNSTWVWFRYEPVLAALETAGVAVVESSTGHVWRCRLTALQLAATGPAAPAIAQLLAAAKAHQR